MDTVLRLKERPTVELKRCFLSKLIHYIITNFHKHHEEKVQVLEEEWEGVGGEKRGWEL